MIQYLKPKMLVILVLLRLAWVAMTYSPALNQTEHDLKVICKTIFFLILSVGVYGALTLLILLSPRNYFRPLLTNIDYIILHTTEGATEGSLFKLRKNGEAHYMISESGQVYQLIQENRIARHAGRSLWNGKARLDENSIGIEIVGFHNQPLTKEQEKALAALLKDLKSRYHVSDHNILTHSMVAYGVPNKWFDQAHRGRKRCGMLMAAPEFRKRIGIGPAPSFDPDVISKRVIVADKLLYSVLYGNLARNSQVISELSVDEDFVITKKKSAWYLAREAYDKSTTIYTLPNGQKYAGNEIKQWSFIPQGTKISFVANDKSVSESLSSDDPSSVSPKLDFKEVGVDGNTAYQLAGTHYAKRTTLYFFVNGKVNTGTELYFEDKYTLEHLPRGTKVLLGYVNGGELNLNRTAFQVAGKRWNSPATVYQFPNGKFITGDEVNSFYIPSGAKVFFEL